MKITRLGVCVRVCTYPVKSPVRDTTSFPDDSLIPLFRLICTDISTTTTTIDFPQHFDVGRGKRTGTGSNLTFPPEARSTTSKEGTTRPLLQTSSFETSPQLTLHLTLSRPVPFHIGNTTTTSHGKTHSLLDSGSCHRHTTTGSSCCRRR